MKKVVFALVFTAGVALLAAACAPAAAPPAPAAGEKPAAPAAKEKPQYGGTLRYVIPNPRIGQDPHKTTGSSYFDNYGRALNTLVGFKHDERLELEDLIISPQLAERWENPDPKVWIFYLHKGIKWHNIPPVNGREFTADDVVYSVKRLASPESIQNGYWQELEKVEALDRYTVKITLKNPSAPFLTLAALGYNKMVAREAVEAAGGDLKDGPNIGTGPWIVTCQVDQECIFKRNPEYFLKDDDGNRLPYLDDIRGLVIPDVQADFASFRAKQLDYRGLTKDERGIVERAYPELIIRETRSLRGGDILFFREDKAPWSDVRVRTAVSKGIDRGVLVETIQGKRGLYALNWPPPGGADWVLPQQEFEAAYKRDVAEAKRLLTEAGYPNGFEASFWVANYGVKDVPQAELIAAQLAEVGIRLKLNVIDRPAYLSNCFIRNGTFADICGFASGTQPEADLNLSAFYHSKGSRNGAYINDPELDKMIEAQRRELVPEKRKQLLFDIQRYLLKMNYMLVTGSAVGNSAQWPWVKNRSVVSEYPGYRAHDYIWVDQELAKQHGRRD